MDSLRNIEVKTSQLNLFPPVISIFSQGRYNHAAVVVLDKIIIIGGKGNAYTGEIVKGKVGTRKKTFT